MKDFSDSGHISKSVGSGKCREIISSESFKTFNRVLLILLALTGSSAILGIAETSSWYILLLPLFALLSLIIAYCVIFLSKLRRISL